MFYSQTFLARKGPLGTVWCAAHLQHRLKKSHYTSTDILSTVERIMFPEVPLALRMSGHLLLGVVRIYSKKVDYLFHDCNIVLVGLRNAFTSIDVTLPEDASRAPFQSITLPDVRDLDALTLDDDDLLMGSPDNHLRSREEITIPDQVPTERDIYVTITFDEDMEDVSGAETVPRSGFISSDRGMVPVQSPVVDNLRVEDPGYQDGDPGNQTEVLDAGVPVGVSNRTDQIGGLNVTEDQNSPPIDIFRDPVDEFVHRSSPPLSPEHGVVRSEPPGSTDPGFIDPGSAAGDVTVSVPSLQNDLPSERGPVPVEPHFQPTSDEQLEFVLGVSGHPSAQFVLQSPSPIPQRRPRPRRAQRLFDNEIVLSNRSVKRALEDTSHIVRKRRNLPHSALGVWRWNNSTRKDQVFDEPSLTGLSPNLCEMFKRDYVSTRSHFVESNESESVPETTNSVNPAVTTADRLQPTSEHQPPPVVERDEGNADIESEHLRHGEGDAGTAIEIERQGNAGTDIEMEHQGNDGNDIEMEHMRHDEGNAGIDTLHEVLPAVILGSEPPRSGGFSFTPPSTDATTVSGIGTSFRAGTRSFRFGTDGTSSPWRQEGDANTAALSDISELIGSSGADGLQGDNGTPSRSQASQGGTSLPVRTRAVAQYLRRHSPVNPLLEEEEDTYGDISLDKILEGKTRRTCARMFFETLVLKTYGLVQVQQDEPYGDIRLKMTPALAKDPDFS